MADFTSFIDKFFKAATLTAPITLTIKEVKAEEIGQGKDVLPVARFCEDPRGLVLSGGRYNVLATAHGSRDTDDWVGAKVEIVGDPTIRFAGKVVGGVVLTVLSKAPKAAPKK